MLSILINVLFSGNICFYCNKTAVNITNFAWYIVISQRAQDLKWHRINDDATRWRRIDVDTTSFWHPMPTGIVLIIMSPTVNVIDESATSVHNVSQKMEVLDPAIQSKHGFKTFSICSSSFRRQYPRISRAAPPSEKANLDLHHDIL